MNRVSALAVALLLASAPPAQPQTRADEQRFREIYKELVETNTSLSAGSCTLAAERMAARLKSAGFAASELHLFTAPGHPQEGGLVAISAGRSAQLKAILLLAHLDVVEAKREDWTREPLFLGADFGHIHGLNEYVGVKSLLECRDFLYQLVRIYANQPGAAGT